MTYPTEFNVEAKQVGPSNIKHPIYTFSVNLHPFSTEAIGPNTNLRNVVPLAPDQYQNSPDLGRTQAAARFVQRIGWLPGLIPGDNLYINENGTITAYGAVGTYLKVNYADIAVPLLTVTNSPPYTSA